MVTWCGVPYSVSGLQSNGKRSNVAILGAAMDSFSTSHTGQAEAPGAVRRHVTYESWVDPLLHVDYRKVVKVVDCGDIETFPPTPQAAYRELQARASTIGRNTDTLITVGGDHTVSAYVLEGLQPLDTKPIALVHLDAHTDTWDDHYVTPVESMPHHASWVRWVYDANVVDKVYQYGIRTMGPSNDRDMHGPPRLRRYGFDAENSLMHMLQHLNGLKATHRIYLSVDLDVCDPAFAPGVAYREPGGWSSAQLIKLVNMAVAELRPIGVDIVECIPNRDRDGLTVGLAHRLVLAVIGGKAYDWYIQQPKNSRVE